MKAKKRPRPRPLPPENRFHIRFDDREIIPENLDSVENIGTFVSGKLEQVPDVA